MRSTGETPIVALTANAMTGQLERCLSAGMDGLLTKPIAIERLREVLDRYGLAVPEGEVLAEAEVAALISAPAQPPPVDVAQLTELAGEDQEFVQSVVVSFEKSMAQLLATMHAAASRGEAQQLARAAHQVKGAAANLYATVLSALAADHRSEREDDVAGADAGAVESAGARNWAGDDSPAEFRHEHWAARLGLRALNRRAAQSAQSPRGQEVAGRLLSRALPRCAGALQPRGD